MAGSKETPRQRMIGMMYLVLTALLALNVSKDIINAFVKLDQKLLDNQKAILSKSESVMKQLEGKRIVPSQRNVVEPYYQLAIRIHDKAKTVDEYLAVFKNQLIKEVEGEDWRVHDPEHRERKLFRPLMEIESKDDYDAATRLFGGNAGSEGYLRGDAIRKKMHSFRNSLCRDLALQNKGKRKYHFNPSDVPDPQTSQPQSTSYKKFRTRLEKALETVKPEERGRIREIYLTLTLPEKIEDYEETVDWQVGMFDHAPVVAAAAMFTSLQNDVLAAEALAMDIINQRVDLPPFYFNAIEPVAIAPAAYLNIGDSMTLRIMTAAFDSNEISQVKWSETSVADAVHGAIGKNKITINATQPGKHTLHGLIGIKQAGDLLWKPWEFTYEVGKPSAFASPLDMNVLYAGIKNRIGAIASGYPNERVMLNAPGCVVASRGNGEYDVTPDRSQIGRNLNLSITARDANGRSQNLGATPYRIRPLPSPMIYLGSVAASAERISRSQLAGVRKISAAYDASVTINAAFRIASCEVSVRLPNGNKTAPVTLINGDVTAALISIFRQCTPGSVIEIRSMRVRGPGDMEVKVTAPSFSVY